MKIDFRDYKHGQVCHVLLASLDQTDPAGHIQFLEQQTASAKVHGTTKLVPAQVFREEREFLRPLPMGDQVKRPMICRTVRKDNTILYDSNRYSVPPALTPSSRWSAIHPGPAW